MRVHRADHRVLAKDKQTLDGAILRHQRRRLLRVVAGELRQELVAPFIRCLRGVTVRRFATTRTRDLASFNEFSDRIFTSRHSHQDEMEWLKQQDPETVKAEGARVPGKGKLKPIEDAPGSYVKSR